MFSRNKVELERNGIDTVAKFKKVIHAAQSKRSSDNIKKFYARQDEARQGSAISTKNSEQPEIWYNALP